MNKNPADPGMRSSRFGGGLCVITDRKAAGTGPAEMVRVALEAGAKWIQYRDKEATRREIYGEAVRIRELTSESGALFIVNDHADIALAVDADGVHLGQDDLPLKEARKIMGKRIIGISTHSLDEAVEAAGGGADYIGFGPVFASSTKDGGQPKGVEELCEIRRHLRIPVVAIGGISAANLALVLTAEIAAVAVASAVLRGDIAENVRAFQRVLRGGREGADA
ncbi:MAG: thiamine phosphate synthase [Nitrospirae bacterium]|nr:thiamine phosphate synthase [Nitrospirota bacterium]